MQDKGITVRCNWCRTILAEFVPVSISPGATAKIQIVQVCKNRKCPSRKTKEPNLFMLEAQGDQKEPEPDG